MKCLRCEELSSAVELLCWEIDSRAKMHDALGDRPYKITRTTHTCDFTGRGFVELRGDALDDSERKLILCYPILAKNNI